MKRIISLLLTLAMCLTVPAGCGSYTEKGGGMEPPLAAMNELGQLEASTMRPEETVTVDGTVEDAWSVIDATQLNASSSYYVPASATVKALWDDAYLYLLVEVEDAEVNPELDSAEFFIDTLWDKAKAYEDDDYNFSVLANGTSSMMSGDGSFLCGVSNTEAGYTVEVGIKLDGLLTDGWVMGFDVRVNDYDSSGGLKGAINLFDRTDSCKASPSALGELYFNGFTTCSASTEGVKKLIERLEAEDLTVYGGYETMYSRISNLKSLLEKTDLHAMEVTEAMSDTHKAYEKLVDASGFPEVKDIEQNAEYPDPFVMLDGTEMETADDWVARRKEISDMYQYYMYGVWRDGSDEIVTYDYKDGTLTVYIERISTGAKAQFAATVKLPDSSVNAPSKAGYPVVVGMHGGISEDVANKNGFATITINSDWFSPHPIASDDTRHTGAFYDLYPYGNTWQEQTGVLMAWSWGCSKILDALEAGLGEELNIDSTNSIVTGVSRYGKAAAVCGAFEPRFKMVAPSCSGAGGLALYRYVSKGKTYDFSSKGAAAAYTYGDNEPLGSLQSSGEVGWFNNNFKQFKNANHLPVDQYMLASLAADEDRYMFIIGSCIYEDWVNAPAMWYTYLASKQIYDYLGVGDNIKINIHKEGHAVIEEDMQYMTEYFKKMVYGIEPESDLSVLDTSVFALEENVDHAMDDFTGDWIINFMLD
ncbi:MAG: hypothetical protein IJ424_00480 [Oscillospiraceae bacterium]|nr:hypothetical protein [Oscillospiraceae bacterium]